MSGINNEVVLFFSYENIETNEFKVRSNQFNVKQIMWSMRKLVDHDPAYSYGFS